MGRFAHIMMIFFSWVYFAHVIPTSSVSSHVLSPELAYQSQAYNLIDSSQISFEIVSKYRTMVSDFGLSFRSGNYNSNASFFQNGDGVRKRRMSDLNEHLKKLPGMVVSKVIIPRSQINFPLFVSSVLPENDLVPATNELAPIIPPPKV